MFLLRINDLNLPLHQVLSYGLNIFTAHLRSRGKRERVKREREKEKKWGDRNSV